MKNEIVFIGTGSGKTSLTRYHSSILISAEDHNLLIDCGDSISRALLYQNIDFEIIDSILISHFHADHYTGLASLITQMHLNKRSKELNIFVNHEFTAQLKTFLNQSYLFEEVLPYKLNFNSFSSENEIIVCNDIKFISKQNCHIRNKHNLDKYPEIKFISSSFQFAIGNTNLVYTSDIGNKDDLFLFDLSKTDILISEITHVEKEIFPVILKKYPALKIFLTHINEDAFDGLISWHKNLEIQLKTRLIICKDGHKIFL